MNPKISVIVPIYNTPILYLEQAITSIERQNYDSNKIEVCIHDDGSNEKFVRLYKDLENTKKSNITIKWSWGSENKGPAYSRNKAVSISEGEFIIILDSDDILHPNAIEQCIKILNKDQKIDLVYSDCIEFRWPSLEVMRYRKKYLYQNYIQQYKGSIFDPVIQSTCTNVGILAFRRSTFDSIHGYNTEMNVAEDIEFNLRFYCLDEKNNFSHIPDVLYFRRLNGDNLSLREQEKMRKMSEIVLLHATKIMGLDIKEIRYFDRIAPYYISHYLLINNDSQNIVPPYLGVSEKNLTYCKDNINILKNIASQKINNYVLPIIQLTMD